MNPCPCGHLGDPRHECECSPPQIQRYRGRVSGPLLDRIDLHVEVPALTLEEIQQPPAEPSRAVAARVMSARRRQQRRLSEAGSASCNAAMSADQLERCCRLDAAARSLLNAAFDKLGLSGRALDRILKVARSAADLAASDAIEAAHVAEAIQYRALDRRLVR